MYELLTLRPLFDGRDRNELLRQIADDEPPPPHALDRSVPTDLETIVLKALRKDAGDRYATAQELADDLGRFLDKQPIHARRPTLAERLRTWARRHPSIVAAGVVVLVLFSAASLVSTALIRHEQAKTWAEQQRAESAYQREKQRAEEAEARFRLARRSVDELIQVSEEELAHRPGMEGLRKRLLTSALAYYQEFIEQRHNDPGAQAELRDTTKRVEKILSDLALLRAANHLYLLVQPPSLDDLRLNERQQSKLEGGVGPCREAVGGVAQRSRPTVAGRAGAAGPRSCPGQRGGHQRDPDAGATGSPPPDRPASGGRGGFPGAGGGRGTGAHAGATRADSGDRGGRLLQPHEVDGAGHIDRGPRLTARDRRSCQPRNGSCRCSRRKQSRRWKTMTGDPIRGSLSPFPSPFGPPRDPKRTSR